MLILASQSPRRSELLKRCGVAFSVCTAQVEELTDAPNLRNLAQQNALLKAAEVAQRFPHDTVLGADTVIWLENAIIGKPATLDEARQILAHLSGKTHEVLTGVAILRPGAPPELFTESTLVHFKTLSQETIDRYLAAVQVLDKAGAYAIQEHGDWIVDSYDGSLENIIGLPIQSVLKRLGTAV